MAASLTHWIWGTETTPTEKLVLFALSEHTYLTEHGDWRVYPSQKTLAALTGLTIRGIQKCIVRMSEAGLITVAAQFDGAGRQQQNMYWLNAPVPEKVARACAGEGERRSGGDEPRSPPGMNHVQGGRVNHVRTIPSVEETLSMKRVRGQPFVPPTREQVERYCSDHNFKVNPDRFIDYYISNGWKVGRNPMRDWQACVRTWSRGNGNDTGNRSQRNSGEDRSAAGRVRANVARELAAIHAAEAGGAGVAADGVPLWP